MIFSSFKQQVISEDVKGVILSEAQRRGYDTGKLIWVKQ